MIWWRRLSLSVRVPMVVALLMMLVGIVASQFVLTELDRQQTARLREIATLHVQALSVALGPHVLRDDIWEVYDTLKRAAGASTGRRTLFSAVADVEGAILAATEPRRAPVGSPISTLAKGAHPPGDLVVAQAAPHVKLFAPLVYQGRTIGTILTELNISDLIADRIETRQILIFGNAVVTAILALLGYFATRRMLVPISRLVVWMGDTEGSPVRFPEGTAPEGDGEPARLVTTYNQMVDAIEAKADTERRLAERERFVSLGRLSSSLAHEINNPLGGLLTATDTIQKFADRPDVVRQSAGLLQRGLGHLRDVARATLEQNRLDRQGASLSLDDFDDLHVLMQPETARRFQTLDWKVTAGPELMQGFPAAPVRQIALNLLLNASEAAGPHGGVGFTLRTRPDNRPDVQSATRPYTLCITVSDTGEGLSRTAAERLVGTGETSPGSGVGLRLVHDLVTELNGHVSLNRAGGITTVEIALPCKTIVKAEAC